ncbi:Imm50 family immunity protein [Streptomyces sp. NPDC093225]|uniref:Imm50 family immunity protein n=1 Tax=Streptomyces sp. NPDC093225 TaxID=3366034 RepID=UPI00382E7A62
MSTSDPAAHPDVRAALAALHELYATPPALGDCLMFSAHVDERDVSVTLAFETRQLPDRPRPEWGGKPYNTFVFSLVFGGAAGLRVHGLLADERREVSLEPLPDGRLAVSVVGPHRSLTFTAATLALADPAVRLSGGV